MTNGDTLYRDQMKDHYRSEEVADEYDSAFSQSGSFRHRLVAGRERKTVLGHLRRVPHGQVLDIPAGTGKLAPVFQRTGSKVLACDVSPEMLRFARERYTRLGYEQVEFAICDAENISSCLDVTYDVAVCLRLLHRVPDDTKRKILAELAAISEYTIVSFGITSTYHKYRRRLRRKILGGDDRPDWYLTEPAVRELVTEHFEIIEESWILPYLSQEKVYLLKASI